jgi:iron complex outermembrane receptor protein
VDLEAAYFRNATDNLIQFMQTSQSTIRAQNMNRALIQGLEVSARAAWKNRLSAYASYTFQRAKDDSSLPSTSGKYLPGRPKDELAAGISWNEKWLSWFSTKLYTDLHYMSGNYLDTQNLISVEHRSLLAAGLGATFVDAIDLSFTVKNLLNERISDLVGYPLPGRSYWANIELKI